MDEYGHSGNDAIEPADVWERMIEAFRGAGRIALPPVVTNREESLNGLSYLARLFASGTLEELDADPNHPRLVRNTSPWLNSFVPNPDASYLRAPVHGGNEYRLRGNRGTARVFDIEVYEGDYSHIGDLKIVDGISGAELEPGSEIDITLTNGPGEPNGLRLRLPSGRGFVQVRNYFYDWELEEPAQLHIDCTNAVLPPAHGHGEQAAALERFVSYLTSAPSALARGAQRNLAAAPGRVHFPERPDGPDHSHAVGLRHQHYGQGRYDCGPDEAVLLEFVPTRCDYWSVSLLDIYWQAIGWGTRQSSLNGHQAWVGAGDLVQMIICHGDPQVANWLDAGRSTGLIATRLYRAAEVPEITLTKGTREEIVARLDRDMPRVSADERDAVLRQRMRAVHSKMA